MQVNAETLQKQIQNLEKALGMFGFLSLDEEYKLDAYRKLLAYMQAVQAQPSTPLYGSGVCFVCRHRHPVGVACPLTNITC